MARIFVSHSSLDGESAQRIKKWLDDIGFDKAFLDFDDKAGIAPGDHWERRLYGELERSQAVILILTRNWFASKWCFAEFTQARALGKAIFAVIESPAGDHFVSDDIQHLDLISNREGGLERLARRLREVALDAQGGFDWQRDRAPYPGLLSFEAADAAIFFGRDDDIRRAVERLNTRRVHGGAKILAILGGSGSGKSSLLKAGILPRIVRDRENFLVLPPFRPGTDPLHELFNAFKAVSPELVQERFDAATTPQSALELIDAVRYARRSTQATLVISIDQGEELFTSTSPKMRSEFFKRLSILVDQDHPALVLLTLRSDHLPDLQSVDGLTARFEEFSLKPMLIERLGLIIQGPARVAALQVEDALVKAIERDAKTQDALPLVAFTLRQLYDRHASSGMLTAAHYETLRHGSLSPLEVAVRDAAKEAIDDTSPTPAELSALREAFVPALVRVNDEGGYVRQRARLDSLPRPAERLLHRLADARLLVISVDERIARVEVAHEAIFRVWPLLAAWLDEEREFLVGKSRIEKAREDYAKLTEAEQTKGLLSGILLDRAKAWLIAHPVRFSSNEAAFIRASAEEAERIEAERAAERERLREAELARAKAEAESAEDRARTANRWRKRAIAAAAVFAVLGAVAIVLGGVAAKYWSSALTEAKRAESLYLADLARQASTRGDYGTAAALSVEALPDNRRGIMRPYVPQAEAALFEAQQGLRELRVLRGHSAAFSPDGSRVVTASSDNTARVWDAATGREIAVLRGHENWVSYAAFSPDGSRVVTSSRDTTARLWDAATGREIAVLRGHEGEVKAATFSPDGSRVGTVSRDTTARLWDAVTGREIAVLRGHEGEVTSGAFSADGKHAVTASADTTARLWDAGTGREIAVLRGHERDVRSAAFSSDGSRIVTASADTTARLWDAGTGLEIAVLRGHERDVVSAAFSPDGRCVVTASFDNTARLWDAATGREITVLRGHENWVSHAAFSPDGLRVVTASADATARLWNAATGREISVLRAHENWVADALFSPDGSLIATASFDNTTRLWDAATGRDITLLRGHESKVLSAAFSPDGSRVVTGSADTTARLWDAATGHEIVVLRGHEGEVNSAAFSRDGNRVITASADATARLWDAATGREIAALRGHEDKVMSVAFSPDGSRVVTASWDNTARLWDAATGREIATLRGHESEVNSAAFSPDGSRVVTASADSTARLWDAATGREIAVLLGGENQVNSAAFSPDGHRIVTAAFDATARLWDAATGREIAVLRGHEGDVRSAVFSPEGSRIVTASFDSTARLWDAATGREIAVLRGHGNWVVSAVFSPDGTRVVTTSADGTARLWDAAAGRDIAVLHGHENWVTSAAFSADGRQILTASEDNTARIWRVFRTTQELVDYVRSIMPHELSPQQRKQFSLK